MSAHSRAGSTPLRSSDLNVGDEVTVTLVDNLTRTQIVQYAGASGDYNPIHTDERYATEAAEYSSVFAHGMLTMGMAGTMLTDFVGDGRLTEFGARFVAQVWPGDTLTGTMQVADLRQTADTHLVDLTITVVNQDGTKVLSGNATATVDP